MATIPIKLGDSELKKIDYLIKIGRYKNRSQAIRTMLDEKLANEAHPLEFEDEQDEIKRKEIVAELKKIAEINFRSMAKKPLAETITEERERI